MPARNGIAGLMHRVYDFQFFLHEALPGGKIVGIELVNDFFCESFPGDVFPVRRHVLRARVVGKIRLIDQVSAALPHQRGTLPRLILRQQREKRCRPLRIVRREKLALALSALSGTHLPAASCLRRFRSDAQSFSAPRSNLRRAHRVRHVPDERDPLLARFVGNGEDGFPRNQRLQLDEVRATLLQIVHGAAAIFRSLDRDRTGKARLRPVEHGPGHHDARADQLSSSDFLAPSCSTSNSPPISRTPVIPLAMNSGRVTSFPRGNQSPNTM